MSTYSQHGEDIFINKLYEHKPDVFPKFVVDVGAGDGVLFSNSRLFIIQHGFDGLLIEPSQEPYVNLEQLYQNTDGIECLNVAVTEKEFKYKMINGTRPGIEHWTLNYVEADSQSKKKSKTLSNLLKERKINDVGILSIDTEGYDTKILREFITNSDIRPTLIIIEKMDEEVGKEHIDILEDYFLANNIQHNQIFLLKEYAEILSGAIN